jgi:hypothetical protein
MAMYFDEFCKKSRCGYGEGTRKAFDVFVFVCPAIAIGGA